MPHADQRQARLDLELVAMKKQLDGEHFLAAFELPSRRRLEFAARRQGRAGLGTDGTFAFANVDLLACASHPLQTEFTEETWRRFRILEDLLVTDL